MANVGSTVKQTSRASGAASGFVLSMALLATACGGGAASGDDGPPDAGSYDCATDTRVDHFAIGMSKTGANGNKFVLSAANPAPPAKGTNTQTITVTDSTGAAVTGATLTVFPFMPDHNHGSPLVPQVTEESGTPGSYDVTLLDLFMPGYWKVTVSLKTSTGALDSAIYNLCIST